jgi:hypothetical protein
VREALQHLGCAAFGDASRPVDDQVLLQTPSGRRRFRSLRWSGIVAITIWSPSRPTHAEVTCGLPSWLSVTTVATASLCKSSRAVSGSAIPAMPES